MTRYAWLDLIDASARLRASGTPHAIATVVRVRGSSYRRPGARMLFTSAGERIAGSISGGCLEGAILRTGWWRTETGPVVIEIDSSDPDDPDAVLGCGGVVEILLERGGGPSDPLAFAGTAVDERRVIATVFATTTTGIGQRWFSPAIPSALAPAAARALASGRAVIEHAGAHTVLVEPLVPPLELFVFGAGLDAVPIVDAATRLGWRANVWSAAPRFEHAARFPSAKLWTSLDAACAAIDRADRAVALVMSHDLRADAAALDAVLATRTPYIGVLGPRHRTASLSPAALADARVRSPVGLDLGAETPDEIAIAVVAEVLAAMRSATARAMRDVAGPRAFA